MVIMKREKKMMVGMERLREATMITRMMSTMQTKLIRMVMMIIIVRNRFLMIDLGISQGDQTMEKIRKSNLS